MLPPTAISARSLILPDQRQTSLILLGGIASREEYRASVQFLCSDASAYLNGQNVIINGGRAVW